MQEKTRDFPESERRAPPEKKAVVLLNFGGPRCLDEVHAFLYEILRDPNTLRLPFPRFLQNMLARRIARRRAPEIQRQYGEIGGKSPIVNATRRVSEELQAVLAGKGISVPVFVAHRYLAGWTDETAREIAAAGVVHLLALPFYPHFSYASSGSAFEQLREALNRAGFAGEVRAVGAYPDHPGYVEALGSRLAACLDRENPPAEKTVVLCSAHGLPAAYIKQGDPYVDDLERTIAVLRQRFPAWRFRLSFQSRVGPMQWLKPYTDEYVPELRREGFTHVVFLPISFVNDHLETLYEIGHTYFQLSRVHGLTPALVKGIEDHPAFVAALAGFVEEWTNGRGSIPLESLLPPDQSFARVGRWAWALWLSALLTSVWFALR